ncbi:MAG: hypothetical protein K2H65_04705, partial [Bacteroidales bacterium]|nr:hypothetical protein [Bacteroidales bacterium]
SETSGYGVIVHYDRAKKDISKIDTISPLPSWDFLAFTDIDDNGMAIGYCGMSLDPGTREPIIYTPLTGVVKMTDYLYEYYDIDVRKGVDLYTPMLISRDGKRLLGFNSEYIPVPYRHELSDDQILPRARNISARAARGVKEVSITWQKPLISLHEVTGYNIYRDDETTPLNTTLLTGTTYTDNTVEAGKHTYYVEAVYGSDGNAMKQVSNTTQVVEPGAAFPVQALNHRVDYNRFAYVYWGVPSSEVIALAKNNIAPKDLKVKGQLERPVETPEMREKETAPSNALRAKSYINTTLDYIANVDMLSYAAAAGIKIGDEYYFTEQTGGGIKVYDRFNEPVKTIRPDGLGIVVSMVNVDNYLFCGTSKD